MANTTYTYQVRAIDAAGNRSTGVEQPQREDGEPDIAHDGHPPGVAFDSSGEGISSATASFTASNGVTKNDNANFKGVWAISNLATGSGTLRISAPGYATQVFNVIVVAGKTCWPRRH